jgi:hypothetical protein
LGDVLAALPGDGLTLGTITWQPPVTPPGPNPSDPGQANGWMVTSQSIPPGISVAHGTPINFEFYDVASYSGTCTP